MTHPKGRERRQFGRRKTNTRAWIYPENGGRIACIVRNISEGGALLEIEPGVELPGAFEIRIESEDLRADCEVRHRTAKGAGVYFVETAPLFETRRQTRAREVRAVLETHQVTAVELR